jgi:alcohol dehydrogenase (cytochrome c)
VAGFCSPASRPASSSHDLDNGKQVWQFQTGSGINAQPITYTHNGKQYVSVLSGIGGLWWNIAREQLKDKVPQGG